MNFRNRNARFASRASSDYHTYLLFKEKEVEADGIITSISKVGYNVLLPRYGFEGMIYFNE